MREVERVDEQLRVADLPARAAAEVAAQLLLERPPAPRRLLLERAERAELALRVDDPFDAVGAERADQLLLQVCTADVEPESLQIGRPEARPFERTPKLALLRRVAETGEAEVEPLRAEPLQKPADRLRTADRHDGDALAVELAPAAQCERLERSAGRSSPSTSTTARVSSTSRIFTAGMVEEARLEQLAAGLTPVTDGWFVVNVPEAAWVTNEALGAACIFEGDDVSFPQLGFTIGVLQPGQSGGRYHREANQEDFLVLAGECLLLIEGEERALADVGLRPLPAAHRARASSARGRPVRDLHDGRAQGWPETGVVYPRSELALRHGAGVEAETTSSAEAYAPFPKWLPGRPAHLETLF